MTTSEVFSPHPRPRRGRWLVYIVWLPLVLGVLVVGGLVAHVVRNSRIERAEIARLRAAGEPVDDETMAEWYFAHTSQEATATWREVLTTVDQALSGPVAATFPIVGRGELPDDLEPGGDWPDEPQVAALLDELRPLLARIEQAAQHPVPVWQPIAFRSFHTLLNDLQTVRSIARWLQLEFEHACYHRDTARALRALEALQATILAFDWNLCLVDDLVTIAVRGIHRRSIRDSLARVDWERAQLERLQKHVADPRDPAGRWQRVIAGERAMGLALFSADRQLQHELSESRVPMALFRLMGARRTYLEAMAAVQQIGSGGVLGIRARAQAFEEETFGSKRVWISDVLTQLLLPSVTAFAKAYERDELDRRMTLTAVGIKRYEVFEGRWPADLNQLGAVGLEAADWTALEAGPFGYRIEAGGPVLWAYDVLADSAQIPAEPPGEDQTDSNLIRLGHVTRIR